MINRKEYLVLKKISQFPKEDCPQNDEAFIASFKFLKDYEIKETIKAIKDKGLATDLFSNNREITVRHLSIDESGLCAIKDYKSARMRKIARFIIHIIWDIFLVVLTTIIAA